MVDTKMEVNFFFFCNQRYVSKQKVVMTSYRGAENESEKKKKDGGWKKPYKQRELH